MQQEPYGITQQGKLRKFIKMLEKLKFVQNTCLLGICYFSVTATTYIHTYIYIYIFPTKRTK